MAVRMAMNAWRERDDARSERHKLRDAIQRAGFAVCQTSGDWTIHDVSEHAKADEQRTDAVIAQNIDLELENKRLREDYDGLLFAFRVQIGARTAFTKPEQEAVAKAFQQARNP